MLTAILSTFYFIICFATMPICQFNLTKAFYYTKMLYDNMLTAILSTFCNFIICFATIPICQCNLTKAFIIPTQMLYDIC